MPVMVGGEKAWKVRRHGDIGVSFQWVNDEPAMILFPAKTNAFAQGGAYVLALSAAFKYADSVSGGPTPYLIRQCAAAAVQLGFLATDTFAIRKIADVILDSLPDLVEMPPEPTGMTKGQAESVGEMLIKLDGETIHHSEVAAPSLEELSVVN